MFRAILYLIATVVILSIMRSVIGVVLKGVGDLLHPESAAPPSGPRPPAAPSGGELKKDPVCGTFISPATSLQKRVGGETYYFCSAACRDQFR
jgi:YHS domain-containing protein